MNRFEKSIITLVLAFATALLYGQGWKIQHTDSISKQPLENVFTFTSDGGMAWMYSDGSSNQQLFLVKVDAEGELQFKKHIPGFVSTLEPTQLIQTMNGDYVAVLYGTSNETFCRLDPFGNVIWIKLVGDESQYVFENDKEELVGIQLRASTTTNYLTKVSKDGVIIMKNQLNGDKSYFDSPCTFLQNADNVTYTLLAFQSSFMGSIDSLSILEIDSLGNVTNNLELYSQYTTNSYLKTIIDIKRSHDNGYVLSKLEFVSGTPFPSITKLNASGIEEWSTVLDTSLTYRPEKLALNDQGEIYYAARGFTGTPAFYLGKLDSLGNVLWEKTITQKPGTTIEDFYPYFDVDQSGNCYLGIWTVEPGLPGYVANAIKVDKDGGLFPGVIRGRVNHDQNNNCTFDPGESPLEDFIIYAEGTNSEVAYTDVNGDYFINVDTGTYELKIIAPSPVFDTCGTPPTVQIMADDTLDIDFVQTTKTYCPYMWVDLSAPFLRNCTTAYYTVNYCNYGTAPAQDSYVEVRFDKHMDIVNSSLPYTTVASDLYRFEVGTVDMMDCSRFTVSVLLDCDSTELGQTLCAEAHIYPDSLCFPPESFWDGSITSLTVACLQDSVQFEIINTGKSPMAVPQNYVVAEDNIIRESDTYMLLPNEVKTLKYYATGGTWRLTADQAPGYFPTGYTPTIAIEGCGFDSTTMQYSTGYITQYSEDDILDYLSIDCQEIIGPFDPNDKRAEPKGYGPEHFIKKNTDIEYHIRFQNVGTDTAFNVIVRDTLSPSFDITSIQLGASSHNYDFAIVNGNTMKFSFKNIKLVDSTTNEPGSHGFLKFRISQLPNLPLGTIINNSAAIYFDYNEPIITNKTFHEIGENFIEILLNNQEITAFGNMEIIAYPNPFSDRTTLELVNGPATSTRIMIYDAIGRSVLEDNFYSKYEFNASHLTNGVYYFFLFMEGRPIGQGKLVFL